MIFELCGRHFAFIALLFAFGCGGGGGSASQPTVHTPVLTVIPASAEMGPGDTLRFHAQLDGVDTTNVTWSADGASLGATIDANGLYTAPATSGSTTGYYQVVATYLGQQKVAAVTVSPSPYVGSMVFSPMDIKRGEQSQITPVFGFGTATLLPEVGPIQNGQQYRVSPLINTTYSITAANLLGRQATASGTVRVWDAGGYKALPSLSTPREFHTATRLYDGKVLITGGNNNQGGYGEGLASAELFDPATNTFQPIGSMNSKRAGHTATLLKDGRVLIIGGWNDYFTISDTAEIYDPATRAFSAAGTMSTSRSGHAAVLLPNGKVLVGGGLNMFNDSNSVWMEIFDPGTRTFTRVRDMRYGRGPWTGMLFGMHLRTDGTVLIAGGCPYIINGELYNPDTDTSVYIDTEVKVGGVAVPGGQIFSMESSVGYLQDVNTLNWTTYGPSCFPVFSERTALATASNGKVIITSSPSIVSTGVVFDPALKGFNLIGPSLTCTSLKPGRQSPTATALFDGRVLVIGGWIRGGDGHANTTDQAECFDPNIGILKP